VLWKSILSRSVNISPEKSNQKHMKMQLTSSITFDCVPIFSLARIYENNKKLKKNEWNKTR